MFTLLLVRIGRIHLIKIRPRFHKPPLSSQVTETPNLLFMLILIRSEIAPGE